MPSGTVAVVVQHCLYILGDGRPAVDQCRDKAGECCASKLIIDLVTKSGSGTVLLLLKTSFHSHLISLKVKLKSSHLFLSIQH